MPYTLRTLLSSDEVSTWGLFCGERGFCHRLGDRDRFTRRFLGDPTSAPDHIIVAVDESIGSRIVGTARLVERLVTTSTNVITEMI